MEEEGPYDEATADLAPAQCQGKELASSAAQP